MKAPDLDWNGDREAESIRQSEETFLRASRKSIYSKSNVLRG